MRPTRAVLLACAVAVALASCSSSGDSVRPPSSSPQARMASRVSRHHRAQGLFPRTTSAVALWPMFSKPQRSNKEASLRPKKGS